MVNATARGGIFLLQYVQSAAHGIQTVEIEVRSMTS